MSPDEWSAVLSVAPKEGVLLNIIQSALKWEHLQSWNNVYFNIFYFKNEQKMSVWQGQWLWKVKGQKRGPTWPVKLGVNGSEKAPRGREESTLELNIDKWPRTMQMERWEQDDLRMGWLGTRCFDPSKSVTWLDLNISVRWDLRNSSWVWILARGENCLGFLNQCQSQSPTSNQLNQSH